MTHSLFISKEFEAGFSKLDKIIQKRIVEKLMEIEEDPQFYGKPLRRNLKGLWSARVGRYRVIYTIEGDSVFAVTVKHRKKVY